jgi:hypothetical protein
VSAWICCQRLRLVRLRDEAGRLRQTFRLGLIGVTLLLLPAGLRAQDARGLIQQAVQTELAANDHDRSRWRYRDEEREKGTVSIVVETDAGSVKRLIERNGHPLSLEEAQAEEERVQQFVHDPSRLAKQRKDGASDDESARQLLAMLPEAFAWKVTKVSENEDTLAFSPRPDFRPGNMQARVLSTMAGEVVLDRRQHRMKTLSGRLTQDVMIGYGLLGRLREGGTFRVERREIKPGLWQIVETHVHIDGKAMMFKQIGQQQDEILSDFTQVPGRATLEQAAVASKTLH